VNKILLLRFTNFSFNPPEKKPKLQPKTKQKWELAIHKKHQSTVTPPTEATTEKRSWSTQPAANSK
jgi:hypothetical protein